MAAIITGTHAPASIVQQFTSTGGFDEVAWTGHFRAITVAVDDGAGAHLAFEYAFILAPGAHTMDVLAADQPFTITLPRTGLGSFGVTSAESGSLFIKTTIAKGVSVQFHD